ncbi:class I adenylate-forming enzyme family protein [Haloactinomyces albus]|uniref:Acyl-CoA synthetase (AMP-forming)/AMP-acid ligase II n=1 Tax=Haloactinomyces albus TaxID=1352928 RepID=A0AAE3ZHR9_9ACTN|nr:AMP-binding protein [Haloactinomyces albus]MDR7303905.1 acyl-CoA synthetase (AMP-forming)/AMP-acid ligase II [Haloactinomyces albus]
MSTSLDSQESPGDIVSRLTGPGGAFELVDDDVLGTRMPVFAHRAGSLGQVLADSLRYGDRDYLVTADRRLTYREHAAQVCSLALALRTEYGVGRGDRVAILAANGPEWIVAFWAATSMGAIAVGYNAWWSPQEISYALGHTRPSVVVADAKRAALIGESDVEVLTVEHDVPRLARKYPQAPFPACEVAEDDPAVIVYTSGTTGRPKGAMHSHRNLTSVIEYHRMNNALAQAFGDPMDPGDRRYLLAVPLFHIAGLHNLVVPRIADGSAVIMHEGRFDVDRVLRLIESERVSNWGAVPTMAHRLLEHGDLSEYDLSSLTAFSLASAPSSPAFHQRLRHALPVAERSLVNSYGLTESSTAISVATGDDLAADPSTLGRPIATVHLEVRDADDNPLPEGEEGEICVRSPFTMLGYWEDEEATAGAIRADRWLHTGDIGVVEHGRVRLTTRRSDLILRGGENVYPAEIENALAEHTAVSECLVLGMPHPDLGQQVAAVVVTHEAGAVPEEELRTFLQQRLAHFKVPTRWRITQEPLPRSATGKVVRNQVTVEP